MRISDWSSDVCSSDLLVIDERDAGFAAGNFSHEAGSLGETVQAATASAGTAAAGSDSVPGARVWRSGRWMVNALPLPGIERTSMLPPWSSMMRNTIDRPRPVPLPTGLVV